MIFFRTPWTVIFTGYERVWRPLLAGTLTVTDTCPDAHGTVTGRPATSVFLDEKVQLTAFVTEADKVTAPPLAGAGDGVAAKLATVGAERTEDTVMTAVVETRAPSPRAVNRTV